MTKKPEMISGDLEGLAGLFMELHVYGISN